MRVTVSPDRDIQGWEWNSRGEMAAGLLAL